MEEPYGRGYHSQRDGHGQLSRTPRQYLRPAEAVAHVIHQHYGATGRYHEGHEGEPVVIQAPQGPYARFILHTAVAPYQDHNGSYDRDDHKKRQEA